MNLSGSIDERLWAAVQSAYESGNYSAAIIDAVFYMSDMIRTKSGLDSDGNTLVGSAFGGQNPIIKINSLYTESERDEQKGIEQLLRGIYTAVRNPRSHEKRDDSSETADTLITFIGWLITKIDKSKSPFDTQQIVTAVFDKHFAQTERYAELLVERIPKRKQLEVLVEVFQRRLEGNHKNISLFTQAVLNCLSPVDQEGFWNVVSECLENANADAEFRSIVQLGEKNWLRIAELARIRAEHRLIGSIKEGEYDSSRRIAAKGSLGTWARDIGPSFILKKELVSAISSRLFSDNSEVRAYALNYLFDLYRQLSPNPPQYLVYKLKKLLEDDHDQDVYGALSWTGSEYLADENNSWVKAFRDSVDKFEAVISTVITDDDIPF